MLTVLKVGGHDLDDAAWLASLARAAASGGRLVLVHGGGAEVSALQRRLGLEPVWRDGLRVTTPETLAVVRMVLSGTVNKRIVSALLDAGVPAAGVSGEDGVLFAAPSVDGRLGRTGTIRSVDTTLLGHLLAAGVVPVLSPVSRADDGGGLNVNADDAAVAVAAALGADRLLFLSNVPGVLVSGGVLGSVQPDQAEILIDGGAVAGGMVPKLRAAARAAAHVADVRIGGLALLSGAAGTRVLPGGAAASHCAAPAASGAASAHGGPRGGVAAAGGAA